MYFPGISLSVYFPGNHKVCFFREIIECKLSPDSSVVYKVYAANHGVCIPPESWGSNFHRNPQNHVVSTFPGIIICVFPGNYCFHVNYPVIPWMCILQ